MFSRLSILIHFDSKQQLYIDLDAFKKFGFDIHIYHVKMITEEASKQKSMKSILFLSWLLTDIKTLLIYRTWDCWFCLSCEENSTYDWSCEIHHNYIHRSLSNSFYYTLNKLEYHCNEEAKFVIDLNIRIFSTFSSQYSI
jgi:hypothetical protein